MASNDMIHVVYAYGERNGETRYNAVRVHASVGTIRIHQAIAAFENDPRRSRREWTAPIEAGSFNIMKIEGMETAAEAIRLAGIRGLAYEHKHIVLNRYKDGLNKAREAFERIGRSRGKQTSQSTTRDQGFTGETESILKEVFGDFLRPGKYGPKR